MIHNQIDKMDKQLENKNENLMHNLLLCISLCHNGRINAKGPKQFICYSEDERCLLLYAKQLQYVFYDRAAWATTLKIRG